MFQQTRKFITQLLRKSGEYLNSQQSNIENTAKNTLQISRATPINTQVTNNQATKKIFSPNGSSSINLITQMQIRNFCSMVPRTLMNASESSYGNSIMSYEQSRNLSTSMRHFAAKKKMNLGKGLKKDPCATDEFKRERPKKFCPKLPPCLTLTKVPFEGTFNEETINCGRICMPCCPPAYFPPICPIGLNDDKPIERIPNPRPAYSEFPKDCIMPIKTCDCPPLEEVCIMLPRIPEESCS